MTLGAGMQCCPLEVLKFDPCINCIEFSPQKSFQLTLEAKTGHHFSLGFIVYFSHLHLNKDGDSIRR